MFFGSALFWFLRSQLIRLVMKKDSKTANANGASKMNVNETRDEARGLLLRLMMAEKRCDRIKARKLELRERLRAYRESLHERRQNIIQNQATEGKARISEGS